MAEEWYILHTGLGLEQGSEHSKGILSYKLLDVRDGDNVHRSPNI